ncbi:sulfatase-like hydrolase/transferase [candidate division KSB1 bacterium]|nr:sulfatase-like hydrolase/transferase [candidate division KSB1 bacterium]
MNLPNILLIHSDQHRADCTSVYGHPLIKTPHLAQLAAGGIYFTHAFCPTPLCNPSRNSLLHGQWSTEHLCIANKGTEAPRHPDENLPAFSQLLNEAGYDLAYVGKWHVHSRTPFAYGFHEYIPESGYTSWRAEQGKPPVPRLNGFFGEIDPYIEPQESRLAWSAGHVIRMLKKGAKTGRPFFVRWDPGEPHLPNVLPEPFFSMYPPQSIPPWLSFPDPLNNKPLIQRQQRRTWKIDSWTWQNWAPVVSRYLGVISLLDAQIGKIVATLEELDLKQNTLIIYTCDHGDMCGGHGMIDKHYVMYDEVVRVPLIMSWAGRIAPGSCCDAFVSHSIDLASTFCDIAGIPPPATFRGQSLLPLMTGEKRNGRQDIFSMYHGNQFGLYSQRMLRNRRWKYIWNATAEDELYDLVNDPGELNNLAMTPEFRDELAQLRRRMVDWMEDINDPLLNLWTRAQLLEGLK